MVLIWRSLGTAAFLLLEIFITGGPARSELILKNDPVFGTNSIVLDTSTGLEWLNLRFSTDLSPAEVLAELQPGGEFAGFRYATQDEFTSLTTDFFSQEVCCTKDLDLTKTKVFAELFGPTQIAENLPRLSGFFGPFPDNETICVNGFFYQINATLSGVYEQDCGRTISALPSPFTGSYLVRAVPEPASITLLCAGLALALLTRTWTRNRSDAGS
jgi:hypothetical protein